MRIIVIASRKGGSGKTTLAGHLGVEAELRNAGPVGLIDLDPQGSLSDWWNTRRAESPHFVRTTVPNLQNDLQALRDLGLSLVIVDTPPALTASLANVMAFADLVLVPTRPSPHDLRSIGATVDLAEELGKPFAFVLNGAPLRARITNEVFRILTQHGPVAPGVVHHRTDFAASMIDGRTVMELPKIGRSAQEVEALWHFAREQLARLSDQTNQARASDAMASHVVEETVEMARAGAGL